MIDSIGGYTTILGASQLLGLTYWGTVSLVKRRHIPTVRLLGSNAVLVKLSDVHAQVKNKK